MSKVNKENCPYCFLDIDINNHRSKLNLAAAFVDATDSRYGFSSKDILKLGGSELSRINDLIATDHEWSSKVMSEGIEVRPPSYGTRIVFKLFWDVAPLACENFATLCTNGNKSLHEQQTDHQNKKVKPLPIGQSGKPLTYKNSMIHRIVPGFIMQGGDFVFGNGSGGESIFNGKKFKDERAGLQMKHDRKGILSMGNSGKNSNSSQFFITFQATPQCDTKHVIFGEVISGFDVLDSIETVGSNHADGDPKVPVQITDCGAYYPFITPGSGYWFDQPDTESFLGVSPIFMTRPRVAVVVPTMAVYHKFMNAIGDYCSCLSLSLDCNEFSQDNIVIEVTKRLEAFTIDLVLVAPIYEAYFKSFDLPAGWKDNSHGNQKVQKDEVILITKPVDAMSTIKQKAWVGKVMSWNLDGSLQ